jgi:hypothetical protein
MSSRQARSAAVLKEALRRLPLMPSTFMSLVPVLGAKARVY